MGGSTPAVHLLHERAWALFQTLLSEERLPTAILLVGPPEGGKHAMVRALAGELLGSENVEQHADVLWIDTREDHALRESVAHLLQRIHQRPFHARYRVVCLDRVDELSDAAAALLLKAIEDAPPFAKFLLSATLADRVAPTIRSRTLVHELTPLPETVLKQHLEQRGVPTSHAGEIARLAGGRPELALRLSRDPTALEQYRTWARTLAQPRVSFREQSALAASLEDAHEGEAFLCFLQSQLRPASVSQGPVATVTAVPHELRKLLRRAREGIAMLRQNVPTRLVVEYVLG